MQRPVNLFEKVNNNMILFCNNDVNNFIMTHVSYGITRIIDDTISRTYYRLFNPYLKAINKEMMYL